MNLSAEILVASLVLEICLLLFIAFWLFYINNCCCISVTMYAKARLESPPYLPSTCIVENLSMSLLYRCRMTDMALNMT